MEGWCCFGTCGLRDVGEMPGGRKMYAHLAGLPKLGGRDRAKTEDIYRFTE